MELYCLRIKCNREVKFSFVPLTTVLVSFFFLLSLYQKKKKSKISSLQMCFLTPKLIWTLRLELQATTSSKLITVQTLAISCFIDPGEELYIFKL